MTLYDQIKNQMKTGDVLQWHHDDFLGGWIRRKTKSFWNHSSLVIRLQEYEGAESRRWTQEAVTPFVGLTFLSKKLESYKGEVWWFPLKDEWEEKRIEIGAKALTFVGVTPYDRKGIVKQLFMRTSIQYRQLFCSEDVEICLGYEKGTALWPGEIAELPIYRDKIKIFSSE